MKLSKAKLLETLNAKKEALLDDLAENIFDSEDCGCENTDGCECDEVAAKDSGVAEAVSGNTDHKPGDRVKIKDTHPNKAYRGKSGTVNAVTVPHEHYRVDVDGSNKKHMEVISHHHLTKESVEEDAEYVDVFLDEKTGEEYYIEFNEETQTEARFVIRVNARGKRTKKLRCPPGKIVKTVNGRKTCATRPGKEKLKKKLSVRKANRTKKAKGAGYKKRINIKRQRAIKKRHQMGL